MAADNNTQDYINQIKFQMQGYIENVDFFLGRAISLHESMALWQKEFSTGVRIDNGTSSPAPTFSFVPDDVFTISKVYPDFETLMSVVERNLSQINSFVLLYKHMLDLPQGELG